MVEDLDDLFDEPGTRDDSLSTEGVEELFDIPADKTGDDGLTLAAPGATTESTSPDLPTPEGSVDDLLSSLADDLKKLADDIKKLIEG